MNHFDDFPAAIDCQVAWKHPEMQTFAVSLVEHAMALLGCGIVKFTTDIVPEADRGGGTGIPGSVVELLKNAHVIEPVGISAGDQWYPLREKSTRPGCKSRYLCVYRLVNSSLAAEFLRRHGRPPAERQLQLQAL